MLPSDSFMSNLQSQLGYSTREFQAWQLIAFAVLGAVKRQLVCKFDITETTFSIVLILSIHTYLQIASDLANNYTLYFSLPYFHVSITMFYFCHVLLYSPFPDIAMTHYSEWSWYRWKVSFKKVWTFGVRGSVYQSVKGNFILGQHDGSCRVLWGPLFPVQGCKNQRGEM